MPLTVSTLAHSPVQAVIPVKDIVRAKRFYTEVMGLEIETDSPMMTTMRTGGDTHLTLYQTQATSNATVAAFTVGDLDSVMKELRGRGATFAEYDIPGLKTVNGVVDMGDAGRSAWVVDSEGNAISIAEMPGSW